MVTANIYIVINVPRARSAAMVSGIFTQRRYRGGEEGTVFTVSNQSKRPDPGLTPLICFHCSTPSGFFMSKFRKSFFHPFYI